MFSSQRAVVISRKRFDAWQVAQVITNLLYLLNLNRFWCLFLESCTRFKGIVQHFDNYVFLLSSRRADEKTDFTLDSNLRVDNACKCGESWPCSVRWWQNQPTNTSKANLLKGHFVRYLIVKPHSHLGKLGVLQQKAGLQRAYFKSFESLLIHHMLHPVRLLK